MPDKTTLTLALALEWDGNASLRQYTLIDDHTGEVLAKGRGRRGTKQAQGPLALSLELSMKVAAKRPSQTT